jgi:Tol biopolymer transport system component
VEVIAADGGRTRISPWHLSGWAPDGRLLVTDDRGEERLALDVATNRAEPVIDRTAVAELAGKRRVGVGKPVWSVDGRYLAAFAGVPWGRDSGRVGTVVLAGADGTPVRLVSSPYLISMLSWSPSGHRLAFTTSGFPDPHELFVLDEPDGEPRRLFATDARHFDWITWSPDGRFLLVDDEHAGRRGRWVLIDAESGRVVRRLPRFGGAPQWCCPVNAYVTLNG